MKLVISGSRETTPTMIFYIERAVRRAHQLGWELLVGDAPGIDAAVIAQADRLNVPVTVYGISPLPRNATLTGIYLQVQTPLGATRDKYAFRDRHMIARADVGLFVWNGASKGTIAAYEYARHIGIKAHLVQPK